MAEAELKAIRARTRLKQDREAGRPREEKQRED